MNPETKKILSEIQLLRQEIQEIKKSAQLEMLTMADLKKLFKVSSKHIYALIKKGLFPEQEKVGRSSRWKKTAIQDYQDGNWKRKAAA